MKINFLTFENVSIYEQLQLEEALLRTNEENWCIVNHGAPSAIVLGISAKPHLLIDQKVYQTNPIPVIRRFSGGGTVYVDENTLFVTFIINQPSFPEKVLAWSYEFYQSIFTGLPFHLRENDYAMADLKFGGNAQYFRKRRFLHHTSFLYDYKESNMDYLLYPPKTPQYRKGRSHAEFLTKLVNYFSCKEIIIEKIATALSMCFQLTPYDYSQAVFFLKNEHRKTTSLVKIYHEVHDEMYECNSCF